jgi:hypothetical protein
MSLHKIYIPFLLATALLAQAPVECVRVVAKSVDRQVRLPAELVAYLSVPIHARVAGFVEKVEVDRGSLVRKGQVLATLVAPQSVCSSFGSKAMRPSGYPWRVVHPWAISSKYTGICTKGIL